MGIGSKLRERGITQYEIAKAEAILRSARAWMYELTEEIWDKAVRDDEITMQTGPCCARPARTPRSNRRARSTSRTRWAAARRSTKRSVLQRCLRDAHAATQHVMLAPPNYETAGKALLGLDPGPWS